VLSHVCEEGDTSEIDVASLSTLTHVTTYIRGEVIALGDFNMEQHRGVQEHHRPVVRTSYRVISCDPMHHFPKS
jgi:hypothetical protein